MSTDQHEDFGPAMFPELNASGSRVRNIPGKAFGNRTAKRLLFQPDSGGKPIDRFDDGRQLSVDDLIWPAGKKPW